MELHGWEEPEIIEEPVLISNSSVFYDDINKPTESLRDIKKYAYPGFLKSRGA